MVDRIRAIIMKRKKLLLVTDNGKYYWTPGGHLEAGETHKQTLRRELKEELGLTLESMKFLHSISAPNFRGEEGTSYYYTCKVSGNLKASGEISSYIWCSFEEFMSVYAKSNQRLVEVIELLRSNGNL